MVATYPRIFLNWKVGGFTILIQQSILLTAKLVIMYPVNMEEEYIVTLILPLK